MGHSNSEPTALFLTRLGILGFGGTSRFRVREFLRENVTEKVVGGTIGEALSFLRDIITIMSSLSILLTCSPCMASEDGNVDICSGFTDEATSSPVDCMRSVLTHNRVALSLVIKRPKYNDNKLYQIHMFPSLRLTKSLYYF